MPMFTRFGSRRHEGTSRNSSRRSADLNTPTQPTHALRMYSCMNQIQEVFLGLTTPWPKYFPYQELFGYLHVYMLYFHEKMLISLKIFFFFYFTFVSRWHNYKFYKWQNSAEKEGIALRVYTSHPEAASWLASWPHAICKTNEKYF